MQHQSYIVTFEDGSEAYLKHFGVKGMKWGVWNAETRARYSGGNREQRIQDKKAAAARQYYSATNPRSRERNRKVYNRQVDKLAKYRGSTETQRKEAAEAEKWLDKEPVTIGRLSPASVIAKKTEYARRERDSAIKYDVNDFYKNRKLAKEYGEKAADEYIAETYKNKVSSEERKQIRWGFVNDDLDQKEKYPGYHGRAFELYVESKEKDPAKYFDNVWKAEQKYDEAIRQEVSEAFGFYENRITKTNKHLDTATRFRVKELHNNSRKN